MFCYQCEETAKGKGCTIVGVCGKNENVANLQDLYLYMLKGISIVALEAKKNGSQTKNADTFIMNGLFSTITNTNFNKQYFKKMMPKAIQIRDDLQEKVNGDTSFDALQWHPKNDEDINKKASEIGILAETNENIRSLKELLTYGMKGIAAYAHHASVLGKEKQEIYDFIQTGLAATLQEQTIEKLTELVMQCGEMGVKTMALLDEANTSSYGHPEPTQVELNVRNNPGILISGHDLKDLEELLLQTKGTGIDIYTHGEMLPANAYPFFKKYDHFIGNYGGSWWRQKDEFEKFNGPILLTSNCLVPPKETYKDRVYTTGVVGFEGVKHIPDRKNGKEKDFSDIIKQARLSKPPESLEQGKITIGFARNTLLGAADNILEAVKSGDITHFVVMAGCDGRHKERDYYTQFARSLPKSAVILTAGCAKYRYNKLNLGEINGIPRVIDAGQCNDSYSLAVIAMKLADILNVDFNELPIIYNIAWYEQKAVLVLLALLHLGVKNIMLGPVLPAFVSSNVLNLLVEKFNVQTNSTVEKDIEKLFKPLIKKQ